MLCGRTRPNIVAVLVITSLAGAAALVSWEPAHARPRPRPVIVRARDVVNYNAEVTIVGKLRHGRPGQKVYLKRRIVGRDASIIREKRVKDNLRVKFYLQDVTRSAYYRIIFRPRNGRPRVSRRAPVEVRPQLRFNVIPNDVKRGRKVDAVGKFKPAIADRKVVIQIALRDGWDLVRKVDVGDGKFFIRFVPQARGKSRVRAVFRGDELNASTSRKERLWIYKTGEATWYGPGFYGRTTACGQTLRRTTLGVAHRKLPCGTVVNFLYRRRTISVKVIDRGPYGEADWDLTKATKDRLRFEGRDQVGFIVER